MLLPKKDREERAIRRFLEYYNQANGASYDINKCEWLDRPPRTEQGLNDPVPDCLCLDPVSGTNMVVEYTMLTGEQDLKLTEGAEKFLTDVRERLTCKLAGVFLLHDWGVNAIRFTANTRDSKIAQLCQEILAVASGLAEGEDGEISQPFPVKLRKEKACKVKTNCALVWISPEGTNGNQLDKQLERVLREANRKFTSWSAKQTVLLVNIWETGLDYQRFKTELFESVDMGEYSSIKHLYLSDGLPDPPIYHLWSYPLRKQRFRQ